MYDSPRTMFSSRGTVGIGLKAHHADASPERGIIVGPELHVCKASAGLQGAASGHCACLFRYKLHCEDFAE